MIAVCAAGFGSPVAAGGTNHTYVYNAGPQVILVSCYRGPLKKVIWDRPEPAFIDSLVAVGYDYPTAHAIGERVCRDSALVNNRAALRQTMRDIYYASPAYR